MPVTRLLLFKESDGTVPIREWLYTLDNRAQEKILQKLALLSQLGHELRRPHGDLLRDGIYELRTGHQKLNLRVLYFFDGRDVVVVAHGFAKQQAKVPDREINKAIKRRDLFLQSREVHSMHAGVPK